MKTKQQQKKERKKGCDYLRFGAKTLYLSSSFLNYRVRTLPEGRPSGGRAFCLRARRK